MTGGRVAMGPAAPGRSLSAPASGVGTREHALAVALQGIRLDKGDAMTTNELERTEAQPETADTKSTTRGGFLRSLGFLAGGAVVGQLAATETADAADNGNMVI